MTTIVIDRVRHPEVAGSHSKQFTKGCCMLLRKCCSFILAVTLGWLFMAAQPAKAEFEWTEMKELNLSEKPLALATSLNGQWIVVLLKGEVQLFSQENFSLLGKFPVDKSFDTMSFSENLQAVILGNSEKKTIKILQIEQILDINVANLPIIGPAEAPITIVVFSDYQ
jgi:hypothetical protein